MYALVHFIVIFERRFIIILAFNNPTSLIHHSINEYSVFETSIVSSPYHAVKRMHHKCGFEQQYDCWPSMYVCPRNIHYMSPLSELSRKNAWPRTCECSLSRMYVLLYFLPKLTLTDRHIQGISTCTNAIPALRLANTLSKPESKQHFTHPLIGTVGLHFTSVRNLAVLRCGYDFVGTTRCLVRTHVE